jgi:hypothetical protein
VWQMLRRMLMCPPTMSVSHVTLKGQEERVR